MATSLFALLWLCGCGGGGNSNSTRSVNVTIGITFPGADRSASRVVPANVNSVLIEVFDGVNRIYTTVVGKPVVGVKTQTNLNLPAKPLTFYATAFKEAQNDTLFSTSTLLTLKTDPKTGKIPKDAYGDKVPLAHAVTTVDVTGTATDIQFTMDNAIVAFVPVDSNPANGPPVQGKPVLLTLNPDPNSPVNTFDLNSKVHPIDANGATVLTVLADQNEITWAVMPNDTFTSNRITLTQLIGESNIHTATIKNTGTAQLIVTDSRVNAGQAPIQSVINFKISPSMSKVTIAIDQPSSDPLLNTPLYAKSVKLTLTETAPPNDFPSTVADAAVTATKTENVSLVLDPITFAVTGVTFNPVKIQYAPSGRPFTLLTEVWSDVDGKGALIASTKTQSFTSIIDPNLTKSGSDPDVTYTLNQQIFLAGDFRIDGLVVTPDRASADVYYVNPEQASRPRTVSLTASLANGGVSVSGPIDSRTVTWSSGASDQVSVPDPAPSAAGVIATALAGPAKPKPVTIKATDRRNGAIIGTTIVTVQNTTPPFNIH